MYVCASHQLPLVRNGNAASCAGCPDPYLIEDDIWLLDAVRREDRAAFDLQVESDPIPLDLSKAERLLDVAGIATLDETAVLDVGCGLGDLTYGLAASPRLRDCDVYAFDHSVASLRRAAAIARPLRRNRVHFSTQDASRLCFPGGSFALIAGSAVLHHILDYRALLEETFRLLRPGGCAVFSEPFLNGYLWPTFLLRMAIDDLHLERLDAPQYGLSGMIVENTAKRIRNADDLAVLDSETDKHYFTVDGLLDTGNAIGFSRISFVDHEGLPFYSLWMDHFLDVYGVTDEALRGQVLKHYAKLREFCGPSLPRVVSHFKFIVLRK